MIRLFSRKIKIDNEELWLTVDKYFYSRVNGTDYYEYHCSLYKEVKSRFRMKMKWKEFYSYKTYWLNYIKYHGDIDKVIDEAINHYKKNLIEQKYISEKERNFKSKYEM